MIEKGGKKKKNIKQEKKKYIYIKEWDSVPGFFFLALSSTV